MRVINSRRFQPTVHGALFFNSSCGILGLFEVAKPFRATFKRFSGSPSLFVRHLSVFRGRQAFSCDILTLFEVAKCFHATLKGFSGSQNVFMRHLSVFRGRQAFSCDILRFFGATSPPLVSAAHRSWCTVPTSISGLCTPAGQVNQSFILRLAKPSSVSIFTM